MNALEHAHRYAAVIRPYLDELPGWDGEFLAYLVDEVAWRSQRTGGDDGDAFRLLQETAKDCRKRSGYGPDLVFDEESRWWTP